MSFQDLRIDGAAMLLRTEVHAIISALPARDAVSNQLDRAASSVVCNAAEARGQATPAKQAYFYSVCRGSSDEVRACLEIFVQENTLTRKRVYRAIGLTFTIGKMTTTLIKRLTPPAKPSKAGS